MHQVLLPDLVQELGVRHGLLAHILVLLGARLVDLWHVVCVDRLILRRGLRNGLRQMPVRFRATVIRHVILKLLLPSRLRADLVSIFGIGGVLRAVFQVLDGALALDLLIVRELPALLELVDVGRDLLDVDPLPHLVLLLLLLLLKDCLNVAL